MKKTPIKTVIAIIKDLEIGDLTDYKIAEKYGVCTRTVSTIRSREGLNIWTKVSEKTKTAIIEDLKGGKLTATEIGQKYRVSIPSVSMIKKKEESILSREDQLNIAIQAYGENRNFLKIVKELKGAISADVLKRELITAGYDPRGDTIIRRVMAIFLKNTKNGVSLDENITDILSKITIYRTELSKILKETRLADEVSLLEEGISLDEYLKLVLKRNRDLYKMYKENNNANAISVISEKFFLTKVTTKGIIKKMKANIKINDEITKEIERGREMKKIDSDKFNGLFCKRKWRK